MTRLAAALRRAARIAVERPRTAWWTMLALTAALFAVGVAGVTAWNIDAWTSTPRGSASMVVYLGEGVDGARAQALVADLSKLAGVERAELVSPQETAHRLQLALGGDSALLAGVELASLPASVEVTLDPGVRDVVEMSPTVRELRGTRGVDDVIVEDSGADRFGAALRVVRGVAWVGGALLAGLALVIVLAAIRVRLDRGAREQATLHLLGASPAFSIVPTALAGALQGALAALLAAAALWLLVAKFSTAITAALATAIGSAQVALPSLAAAAAFVALGGALGLVGGSLAGVPRAR